MKKFVGWDGETVGDGPNTRYTLLQNSEGETLRGDPVRIEDAAEMMMGRPDWINVWYYSSLDWNMLFQGSPKETQWEIFSGRCGRHSRALERCKKVQKKGEMSELELVSCMHQSSHEGEIGRFLVTLLPKKILRLQPVDERISSVHYDTYAFFARSFTKALDMCKIPVPDVITEGKALRGGTDEWRNWPKKEEYNLLECKLLAQMMDMLRAALTTVGYGDLSGWHGPGAIASKMMDNLTVYEKIKGQKPRDWQPAVAAYYGGRNELFKRGEYLPVHNYDINSAYPTAARELPDLSKVSWKKVVGDEALDYDFGVARLEWEGEPDCQMGPFPFRVNANSFLPEDNIIFPVKAHAPKRIAYPAKGRGQYHLVEAKAAIKKGIWDIKVKDAWVIDNGFETPYWKPIDDIMRKRLEYKAKGDFAHLPLKLGANSWYGKFAERIQDTRSFGRFNCMLYCGYMTSWTRATILGPSNPEELIMISTDGLYSRVPLDVKVGENLGEWEHNAYKRGRFILPGIYQVDDTVRKRGYPDFDRVGGFDWIYSRCMLGKKIKIQDKTFIPIKKSLRSYRKFPMCGFYEFPREIDPGIVSQKRAFVSDDLSYPYQPTVTRESELQSKLFDLFAGAKPDEIVPDEGELD